MTEGILEPELLGYATSAHNYILKPSDASNLESSDVIFYTDDNLETFVQTFAKNNKELVQLSKVINLLPARPHSFSRKITNTQDEKRPTHLAESRKCKEHGTFYKCNIV
nr:metal ABC transporter substrate-binding protein [Rickettsia endosymbiont of Ceutorhynchus assimilis]